MPHICSQCDNSFSRLNHYNAHLKRCSGQGRYYCKLCKYSLADTRALERHISSRCHRSKENKRIRSLENNSLSSERDILLSTTCNTEDEHLTCETTKSTETEIIPETENTPDYESESNGDMEVNNEDNSTEDTSKDPWYYANDETVLAWRDFSQNKIFRNIHKIDTPPQHCNAPKRGPYKSTTSDLDYLLSNECTQELLQWRREDGDGLSNKGLDKLLSILHNPNCNIDLLPHNHYQLDQLQERALSPLMPKTTRWQIPKDKNENESEEVTVVDIADLLRLELQNPEVTQSMFTSYNENGGIISHPSHGEIWKKLDSYDKARNCQPLCLMLYFDDYDSQYYKERKAGGIYLTIANLTSEHQRKISNQHLICSFGPTADRRSVQAIAMNMIWDLEKLPVEFQVGPPGTPNSRSVLFQVHLFVFPADRKGSSEMIWHMGVAATHPCHACNVEKKEQCILAKTSKNINSLMRDYGDLLEDILHGCEVRHNLNDPKAAQALQTETGFYNICLPTAMWSNFFNPIKQTPPCLMHNGPLGLFRTMIKQFLKFHGKPFADFTNEVVRSHRVFPGMPKLPNGIFSKECSLKNMNADQVMGFMRSSPAFIWRILPKKHFKLWMLVLKWFSILYAMEFHQNNLDCGSKKALVCTHTDGKCIRHMGRFVINEWLGVFSDPSMKNHDFSDSFWNLHVQLHMHWYIQQLGPLYLLSTSLGESHHAIQKRYGRTTNHQSSSMDAQILKKNLIVNGWKLFKGLKNSSVVNTSLFTEEYSLHSSKNTMVKIVNTLKDVFYNAVKNSWDNDIRESDLPSEGEEFKKMYLHGHYIGYGNYVAIRGENSRAPWFARIERFLRFKKDDEAEVWDIAEVKWLISIDASKLSKRYQDIIPVVYSNGCDFLKDSSKSLSNDFIAVDQILFRADITPIKEMTSRKSGIIYIYNPWTSSRFFSNNFNDVLSMNNDESE